MSDQSDTKIPISLHSKKKFRFRKLIHHIMSLPNMFSKDAEHDSASYIQKVLDEGSALIGKDLRLMISNIVKLKNLTVADIMIPRADIIAVDIRADLEGLMKLFASETHSRIPVFRDTLDDVIGMVHIKDMLPWWHSQEAFILSENLREILFVSPTMRILDLLVQMRHLRVHMALVVDEFGGTDGLVTIENLVEEIVGEIEDEHDDQQDPLLEKVKFNQFIADGRVALADFENEMGAFASDEEREEVDTLGGLVYSIVGRIPARGEIIKHPSGVEFEITDADPRRIKKLKIHRKKRLQSDNQSDNLLQK